MKVCYLSSTKLGIEMFDFLKNQNCTISYYTLKNEKINFEEIDYDLGISFLYTHKIPASEFIKNKIWINFHPGPLPNYRGRNLCYHAIVNGEKEFGATLHYMDAEYDTGKIIKLSKFPIEPYHNAGDLSILSKHALVSLCKEYVPKFLSGKKIIGRAQTGESKYYKKTKIDDVIHLSYEQEVLVRAVTASPFYAHTHINGRKYYFIPESDISDLSR